jgi:hypothetical protein
LKYFVVKRLKKIAILKTSVARTENENIAQFLPKCSDKKIENKFKL